MSTFALGGSDATATGGGRPSVALRYADLALLALALPVFVIAGLPLLGYAVAALAWLTQHAMLAFADHASAAALAARDRRRAMGIVGAVTLGRVWLVALAILLVGLLAERADGLAAAVLTLALVTVHLACLAIGKLLYPESPRP